MRARELDKAMLYNQERYAFSSVKHTFLHPYPLPREGLGVGSLI